MKYTYLLLNLGSILIPLIFSFHPKIRFYRNWSALWPAVAVTSLFFISWDVLYTHWNVWTFNPTHVMGVYLLNLPLEEWLFFICIPYACVFSWHCMKVLFHSKNRFKTCEPFISAVLILIMASGILLFYSRLYTVVICLLLMVALILLKYFFNVQWLGTFYFTYMFLLIPTFLINGMISGLALDQPIVWYNKQQILNVRLLTIPIEDLFYGLLLILLNVALYEHFKTRYVSHG